MKRTLLVTFLACGAALLTGCVSNEPAPTPVTHTTTTSSTEVHRVVPEATTTTTIVR